MRKEILFVTACLMFLALGLVGVMGSFAVTTSDISAEHGTSASGSFSINNTDLNVNLTDISCSVSVGSWTTSVSCPTIVEKNSSSSAGFSASVPQYISSGSYSGSITVNGNFSGTIEEHSVSFNVNVREALDFSLSFVKELSEVYMDEKGNFTVRVTNTGNTPLSANFSMENNLEENESISFGPSTTYLLPSNYTDVMFNITPDPNENYGPHYAKLKVLAYNATYSTEKTIEEERFDILYPLCDVRESGYISLYDIVNDADLIDEDFEPLDTMNIELKIRNTDDERRYAKIEAVLVYKNDEVDDTDVEEKIRVDRSDILETSIAIKIPADIKEGHHYLYVNAYDYDETDNCNQKVVPIDIVKESFEVLPYYVEVEPSKTNCSEEFTISGKLINTGSHDEDKVKVIYSDEFGNSDSKVFNNLDEGDESSLFSFAFEVPEDAGEKIHKLTLKVYYDYDDIHDEYDAGRTYEYSLEVEGNCLEVEPETEFSLVPQITGFIGKNLYATVIVENTGSAEDDFEVEVECNWATISSIEPANFSLDSDESKSVVIKLVPKSGTSEGLHDLDVEIKSGGETETQTVSVYVFEEEGDSWYDNFKSKTKMSWLGTAAVAILALIILGYIVYFVVRPRMPNFIKALGMQKQ